MSSSSSPSGGGGDGNGSEKEGNSSRPRFFNKKAKSICWAKAETVPGRHPERWRKDAADNIVCQRFANCLGCLCYEYDHTIPYSKDNNLSYELLGLLMAGFREMRIDDVSRVVVMSFDNNLSYELLGLLTAGFREMRIDDVSRVVVMSFGGESVAENCQILQSRVNRSKSNKDEVDTTQMKGYSCDIKFTDKELDIVEMAVYGDVIRPGNLCRCRTVAEMLGKYKSKDSTAACKLPQSSESL
ncbi:hypothetical protein RHGRI_038888 [Rhododendron griersonianum]|uniref:HNH endonuclease n=1 Tax=Rhododendron griersonianum TaxID=479676 RepID=A0AAV6HM21_9ERIC|nr:hypothetical protein RHGRI_038888 [Rhododendron griersonianum]